MEKSRIVYTCVTNSYDTLKDIVLPDERWRAICYTDKFSKSDTWEIVMTDNLPKVHRHIKICPHSFLPSHSVSIWIDANLELTTDLNLLADKLGSTDLVCMTHLERDCIYEEGAACVRLGKDDPEIIAKQMSNYESEGYPQDNGLFATGVLIRKSNKVVADFNDAWWIQVFCHSIRDQLSFPVVAHKMKLNFTTFPFLEGFKKVRHSSKL